MNSHTLVFDSGSGSWGESIQETTRGDGVVRWVIVETDNPAEALVDVAPPAAVAGLRHVVGLEALPGVFDAGDHVLVVLQEPISRPDGRVELPPVECVVSGAEVVTLCRAGSPAVDSLTAALDHVDGSSPRSVVAVLAVVMGERYRAVGEALDDRVEELAVAALNADPVVLASVQGLRMDDAVVRKALRRQRTLLADLAVTTELDIAERAQRSLTRAHALHDDALESILTARSLLSDALDTYRGAAAERTGSVTTVLTIYAAILLPLSLLAGIFGMNHQNLPGTAGRAQFWALIAVMVVLAVASWIGFARAGYLRGIGVRRSARQLGAGIAGAIHAPTSALKRLRGPGLRPGGDRDVADLQR